MAGGQRKRKSLSEKEDPTFENSAEKESGAPLGHAELKGFIESIGLSSGDKPKGAPAAGGKRNKKSGKVNQINTNVSSKRSDPTPKSSNTGRIDFGEDEKLSSQAAIKETKKASDTKKKPSAKQNTPENGKHNESLKGKNKGKDRANKGRERVAVSTSTPSLPALGNKSEDGKSSSSAAVLRKKLRLEIQSVWYNDEDCGAKCAPDALKCSLGEAAVLQQEAGGLLVDETRLSEELHTLEHKSEEAWMKTILKDGTLADRLAAWMLRIQESPLHRLRALDTLLSYAGKKKREALQAVDTLREIWLINLLPDRKLLRFVERPLKDLPEKGKRREQLLILWHYEAELKTRYAEFVGVLEQMAHTQLPEIKRKVLGTVFELLSGKPEQEQQLLSMICNKMGDPDAKVAGKAQFYLKRLLLQHPRMKTVVAKEVHHMLSRPNVGIRAQYTAVCFLNQFELSRSDEDKALARRLVDMYFQCFETVVKSDTEVASKLLSALLSGVNRAHPFADMQASFFDKYSATLFKMVHTGTFNCSVQALLLLCQVLETSEAVSDRYFRALYGKLLDPELHGSSKQAMFLNVVFRSMKMDPSVKRQKAFAKRLLQVLCVLAEVASIHPAILSLLDRPLLDLDDDDDEEEHFVDAPDEDASVAETAEENTADAAREQQDSGDIENNTENKTSGAGVTATPTGGRPAFATVYDPRKREPLYAGAERTYLWELSLLRRHYHPSVVSFCSSVAAKANIAYTGDPLRDFALARFLDKFVFKKPKAKASDKGGSVMQPKHGVTRDTTEVNSEKFWKQAASQIPVDQLFYHRYFKQRVQHQKGTVDATEDTVTRKRLRDDDDDDEGGDAFDADVDVDGSINFAGDVAKSVAFAPDTEDAGNLNNEGDDDDDDDNDVIFGGDDDDDDDDDEGSADPYAALGDDDFEDDMDESGDGKGEMLDLEAIAREGFGEDSDEDDGLNTNVFASADEFSHLMEDEAAALGGKGGMQKQTDWERGQKYVRSAGASRRRPSKRARKTGKK